MDKIRAALPNTTNKDGYLIDRNGKIFAHLDYDGVYLYEKYEHAEKVYRRLLAVGIVANVVDKK